MYAIKTRQTGFGIVSAVFLLVILAILAASITFFAGTQRSTAMIDLLGARAYQAARAGVEWGAFQALVNGSCGAANLTFAGTSMAGFTTTVTCAASTTNEGGRTVTIFSIQATACNIPSGASCPNAGSNDANYVERQVTAVIGG